MAQNEPKEILISLSYNVLMKKTVKHWLIVILSAMVLIGGVWYCSYKSYCAKQKIAYVYLDRGSFASLLQMTDFIKQDVNAPKLIFWERLFNLNYKSKLLKNVTALKSPQELQDEYPFIPKLKKFIKKYPNAKFVIHVNLEDHILVWDALQLIPKERIEKIHFYEDSFGRTVWQPMEYAPTEDLTKLLTDKPIRNDRKRSLFSFSVMRFYPSVLHIALADIAKENPFTKKHIARAETLAEIHLEEIAKSLTQENKKNLLDLLNIKEDALRLFKSGKPVLIYCMGFFYGSEELDTLQIDIFKNLVNGKLMLKDPARYAWAYKEHPWYRKYSRIVPDPKEFHSAIYGLPRTIPLEVLFLTGYMPEKIMGYSSSVFFAVPKEKILFYIRRDREQDTYLPILKRLGKITEEQIYTLDELKNYKS